MLCCSRCWIMQVFGGLGVLFLLGGVYQCPPPPHTLGHADVAPRGLRHRLLSLSRCQSALELFVVLECLIFISSHWFSYRSAHLGLRMLCHRRSPIMVDALSLSLCASFSTDTWPPSISYLANALSPMSRQFLHWRQLCCRDCVGFMAGALPSRSLWSLFWQMIYCRCCRKLVSSSMGGCFATVLMTSL